MIRIGCVNLDTSHPPAFAGILSATDRARYTAVYNDGFRDDREVQSFIRKFKLEKRCSSIEELAACTDIGFIHSCNWDNHVSQAMPFIHAGKPVFIDKPIAGSVRDCRQLERLSETGGVVLGSSSFRYAEEIARFKSIAEEDRGRILNIYGTIGVDEFSYAIHIVEAFGGLANADIISCRHVGSGTVGNCRCDTFYIRYEDGMTALFNCMRDVWHESELVVMTTKGTFGFRVDVSKVYQPLLQRICCYMETGVNTLAPVGKLTESVKALIAGRLSMESGGREIRLQDIPEEDPGFDGDAYETRYAAAARKIHYEE